MKDEKLYWHFLPADRRLQYGTREVVEVGKTLMLPADTVIKPCSVGFHASELALDALQYAPGPIVCQVTLHGQIIPHGYPVDKYCAHGRTVLWMTDATATLREFARWCALQVIHLWDAPDVVREYLTTGDESIRVAARDAAGAAKTASWATARTARAAWMATWVAQDVTRTAGASWAAGAARATRAAGDAGAAGDVWAAGAAGDVWAAGAAQNKKLTEMLLSLKREG